MLLHHVSQMQTVFFMIPFAIIQLATGFSLISLKHYTFSAFWVTGSIFAFIAMIISWLTFIYLLLLSQQAAIKSQAAPQQFQNRYYFLRRLQTAH